MNRFDPASLKRAAAARALDYVTDGMKLGLGTARRRKPFWSSCRTRSCRFESRGTPTSERTSDKAEALGIALKDLDTLAPLDLVIDGADEADRISISSKVGAARCSGKRSSRRPPSAW